MREPPAMDNALSKSVLNILSFAPLMMLFNGYWLLDNKQFFENIWNYKAKSTDNMKSGHLISIRVTQSSPLLLAGILCVAVILVQIIVKDETLKAAGYTMAREDLDVDEDLPNFFEALPVREATRMLAENDQMQREYGLELIEADLVEKLEAV